MTRHETHAQQVQTPIVFRVSITPLIYTLSMKEFVAQLVLHVITEMYLPYSAQVAISIALSVTELSPQNVQSVMSQIDTPSYLLILVSI